MKQHLSLLRLYFVLLAIFTIGRWAMGFGEVEYVKGHHIFSLMILTIFSSLYYGAFTRRHLGYRVTQAMAVAAIIAFSAQLVILVSTLLSFATGETYFTHPVAVNVITWDQYLLAMKQGAALDPVSLGDALPPRLLGLVANTISGSIVGALGWAMGALLPKPSEG